MVEKKPKAKKKREAPADQSTKVESQPGSVASASAATAGSRKDSEKSFTPDVLESTIIAIPLLEEFEKEGGVTNVYDVIIDINLEYPGGRDLARKLVRDLIRDIVKEHGVDPRQQGIYGSKTELSEQYIFARLRGDLIQEMVRRDRASPDMVSGQSQ